MAALDGEDLEVAAEEASITTTGSHESRASSIVSHAAEKAQKLKSKLKSKLNQSHNRDNSDEDAQVDPADDGDDPFLEEPGAGPGTDAVVIAAGSEPLPPSSASPFPASNTSRSPAKTSASSLTAAQAYATNVKAAGTFVNTPSGKIVTLAAMNQQQQGDRSAPGTPVTRSPRKSSEVGTRSRSSTSASTPATQSDWKRKAEFANYFVGEVSEGEELISDYTSAWFKDILRHGRLYVGTKHLAFICTFIGLKTSCVIAYSEITYIEKTVTARVIPNAILIHTTREENYLFSSFVQRDAAWDLIVDCWRLENPQAYEAMIMCDRQSMGDDLASADGDFEANDVESSAAPLSPVRRPSPTTASVVKSAAAPVSAHPETHCTGKHFKETALDTRVASSPAKVFEILYRSDEFQQTMNEHSKLRDFNPGEWQAEGNCEKREYSYTKPLDNSVGPSQTTCLITDEILAADSEKAYEVLTITKTPDVPSGSSFEVHTKTCLTWAGGPKGGCRIFVTTECVWTGRSMLKGIITSASVAGQKAYNKELAKEIRAFIRANPKEYGLGDSSSHGSEDDNDENEEVAPAATHPEAGAPKVGSGRGFLGRSISSAKGLQGGQLTSAILALSNIVLLVSLLIVLMSDRSVKVSKVAMSSAQEQSALERLRSMETSWAQFRQCVDALAAGQDRRQ